MGLAGAGQFSSISFPAVGVPLRWGFGWAAYIRTHPTTFHQFKVNSHLSSATLNYSKRAKIHWAIEER